MEKRTFSFGRVIITLLVLSLLITAGFYYVRYQEIYPSTDDAYIHGNILYVSPQISGQITSVEIKDYQHVEKGQLIAQIDPALYQARLDQARAAYEKVSSANNAVNDAIIAATAEMKGAEANLKDIQTKYQRQIALVKQGVLSKQVGDDVKAELNVAKNKLDATRANINQLMEEQGAKGDEAPAVKEAAAVLAEASINLSYTQIVAAISGQVGKVNLQKGSVVRAGQALMPLVQKNSFWVQANYKGKDVGRFKPGMKAKIALDMYPELRLIGEVVAVSPASGASFSLLPPENATGNWVKVPQRFPVRIHLLEIKNNKNRKSEKIDNFQGLRVGSNASVTIDTHSLNKKKDKSKPSQHPPQSAISKKQALASIEVN